MTAFPQPAKLLAIICAVAALAAACAPAPGPAAGSSRQEGTSSAPKSLTFALQTEPANLITILGGDAGGGAASTLSLALHQHLATYDSRGQLHPALAAELPSQADGTWVVRPDGTMQTTYRLRRDVLWHDGTPLKAQDFVLAWKVMTDGDLPVTSATLAKQIGGIDTPDDFTLVIAWSRTTPDAVALVDWDLGPLPTHLLEGTYPAEKERFERSTYWNRELVGVGPYRLAEWELGSHITLKAFDQFYGGRAKIDTITARFISNEPTVVANLLAGTVDGAYRSIDFEKVMLVKNEWERGGKQPLAIVQPTFWRVGEVQYRDAFRDTRARDITDVQVRRALLHAIDRRGMVEALYAGLAPPSDVFLPPDDFRYEWVKDSIVRYEHNPRRAQELLDATGWRRGSDGAYLDATGERINVPLWTTEGGTWEREIATIADYWKAIGINTEQRVIPSAQARDRATRASFPGFATTAVALDFSKLISNFYGPNCATEQTRWVGDNRSCYQDPAADRLIDGLSTAVNQTDQQRLTRELARAFTESLPGLPLTFHVGAMIFREGVTGVKGDTRPTSSVMWNVAEWDVRL